MAEINGNKSLWVARGSGSTAQFELNKSGQIEVISDTGEIQTIDLPSKYYTKDELGPMYSFCVKPESEADGVAKVWTAVSASRYKVVVEPTEFNFTKPYIDDVIVFNKSGTGEKTILEAIELLNGKLVIYSNIEIDCKIILKGE